MIVKKGILKSDRPTIVKQRFINDRPTLKGIVAFASATDRASCWYTLGRWQHILALVVGKKTAWLRSVCLEIDKRNICHVGKGHLWEKQNKRGTCNSGKRREARLCACTAALEQLPSTDGYVYVDWCTLYGSLHCERPTATLVVVYSWKLSYVLSQFPHDDRPHTLEQVISLFENCLSRTFSSLKRCGSLTVKHYIAANYPTW